MLFVAPGVDELFIELLIKDKVNDFYVFDLGDSIRKPFVRTKGQSCRNAKAGEERVLPPAVR
jgi:hypothetical protein